MFVLHELVDVEGGRKLPDFGLLLQVEKVGISPDKAMLANVAFALVDFVPVIVAGHN